MWTCTGGGCGSLRIHARVRSAPHGRNLGPHRCRCNGHARAANAVPAAGSALLERPPVQGRHGRRAGVWAACL